MVIQEYDIIIYRQNDCTPNSVGEDGLPCPPNPEALFCSTQAKPVHYPGSMVFVVLKWLLGKRSWIWRRYSTRYILKNCSWSLPSWW